MEEAPKPFVRKKKEPAEVPAEWWDRYGPHPLSDAEFVTAYCQHVFATTADHSLRIVRDRAYRFIKNFLAPELQKELSRYREVHQ